jgi:hypothetical protein
MSKIEVNAIEPQCGTNLTVGASGDTITFPSGTTVVNNGSQTGFGRTGTVDWDTTPKTATFSAVSGNGYFCNTSGGAFTVNLPAGSAGAIVSLADYAATWQTNNLTITPNGSDKIGSQNENAVLTTEGQSVTFVFVDSTQGWINTMDSTSNVRGVPPFVTATGGTITECGDYKIHTFTGPGTFTVTNAGTPAGSDTVEYVVVAGGGGGGGQSGNTRGGAGAGGFRFAAPSLAPLTYPAKPLAAPAGITASVQAYPITVGSGGAGNCTGTQGANSVFSTITSSGGANSAGTGGSGGGGPGGSLNNPGGAGNTPPVSPPQGNNGGTSATANPDHASGGGGGAVAVGGNGKPANPGSGPGGIGAGTPTGFGSNGQPCGSFRYYAGGGGGGGHPPVALTAGVGGVGGGASGSASTGSNATANTGGGGGAGGPTSNGGNGGSGIVIIRYKFQ